MYIGIMFGQKLQRHKDTAIFTSFPYTGLTRAEMYIGIMTVLMICYPLAH